VRTRYPIGPSPRSDLIVALGFIYEFVNATHRQQILARESVDSTMSSKSNMSRDLFT
jgi:hypothetical protein